jgi:hypothetical protein
VLSFSFFLAYEGLIFKAGALLDDDVRDDTWRDELLRHLHAMEKASPPHPYKLSVSGIRTGNAYYSHEHAGKFDFFFL